MRGCPDSGTARGHPGEAQPVPEKGDGGEGSGKLGWVDFAGGSAGGERGTQREARGAAEGPRRAFGPGGADQHTQLPQPGTGRPLKICSCHHT